MKIIECKIHIPNTNLDTLKDRLRNLGNRYIENGNTILNISRHKLARAGNAAIALRACKLEPIFDNDYNIVNFKCDTEKEFNITLILDEIAAVMDRYGYLIVADTSIDYEKYIYAFENGKVSVFKYDDTLFNEIKAKSKTDKKKIYCKNCVLYINNKCIKCDEECEDNDFCSRGEEALNKEDVFDE